LQRYLKSSVACPTASTGKNRIAPMRSTSLSRKIARVLSKLGRHTGKGNRWTQARVATVRLKHHIAAPAAIDPEIAVTAAQSEKAVRQAPVFEEGVEPILHKPG
jgi:hypothetical protein